MGDYKLVVGSQNSKCDDLMHSPLDYPCTKGPLAPDCDPNCLYNIHEDPQEKNDLYHSQKAKADELLARYMKYAEEPRDEQDQGYHNQKTLPDAKKVACRYFAEHGGYWQPWLKSNNPGN